MGTTKTVIKTIIVILGILLILASFGASVVANEVDRRVSEDCEDTVCLLYTSDAADEEQCQDARDLRDNLRSAILPLIVIGSVLVVIPIISSFRKKSER